jgi:hypothetical protein
MVLVVVVVVVLLLLLLRFIPESPTISRIQCSVSSGPRVLVGS